MYIILFVHKILITSFIKFWHKIRFNKQFSNEPAWSSGVGQLALDVTETSAAIVVVAPLAGIDIADVEIMLNKNILTIRGERKNSQKSLKKYITQECFWGKFARSIVLPDTVEYSKVKATYKNGVLKILIPKNLRLKSKLIKIVSG